jgi:hypothetical protein
MQQSYRGLSPEASDAAKQEWELEHEQGGFACAHCGNFVTISETMGTFNRNHCNVCLWSKHVDEAKGDRKAVCGDEMEPIGLTFKHQGEGKVGELMLVHHCQRCQKVSINRIARDDPEDAILAIYTTSLDLGEDMARQIALEGISIAVSADEKAVREQLFGKASN